MKKRSVAFVTCPENPAITSSDQLAANILVKQGVQVDGVSWADSTDWQKYNLIVIRSAWFYWNHYEKFLNWITELQDLTCQTFNSPKILKWNSNKIYLKELEEKNIQIAPTYWLEINSKISLKEVMDSKNWSEVVIKPAISGNAFLTYRVTRNHLYKADEWLRDIWKFGAAMVQPYFPEIETGGEYSLVFFDKKFSHGILKTPKLNDFRVQESFGGKSEAIKPDDKMLHDSERILDLIVDPLLYARIDFIKLDNQNKLMELELLEPSLFLEGDILAPNNFAEAILKKI